MTIYLRNIENIVKSYGRQMGKRLVLGRIRDPEDKVTISEEGKKRLLEDMARRLNQSHAGTENITYNKKILFKKVDREGEEQTEELSLDKQSELLERFVENFLGEEE